MGTRMVVHILFSTAVPISFSREEETKNRRDNEEEENECSSQLGQIYPAKL